MHLFEPKNADEGLKSVLLALKTEGVPRASRVGSVLEFNSPSMVTWKYGASPILRSRSRDANPFFHMFEALWMLAGRSDLQSLLHFNSSFDQFSDDGKEIRGSAYGKRWRSWFKDQNGNAIDQIPLLVKELSENLSTRRAVLLMWDATDLNLDSKDVPCNSMVYFLVRNGRLDMSVVNRSNDAIFGLFGSNVVHFHFLHQYITTKLSGFYPGLKRGDYYQLTNNLHAYVDNPIFDKVLTEVHDPVEPGQNWFWSRHTNPEFLDYDITQAVDSYRDLSKSVFRTDWFNNVAFPMITAWNIRKEGSSQRALGYISKFSGNSEWLATGRDWLQWRVDKQKAKS